MKPFPQHLVEKYNLGGPSRWRQREYKWDSRSGIGDFVGQRIQEFMKAGDKSDLAYNHLLLSEELCNKPVRWPEDIQKVIPPDRQRTTRLGTLIDKEKHRLCKRLGLRPGEPFLLTTVNRATGKEQFPLFHFTRKSRAWHDMTKDPYINYFTFALWLLRPQAVLLTSMPYYLWRLKPWVWHRLLKNLIRGKKDRLRWHLFWFLHELPRTRGRNKDFVKWLDQQMTLAVNLAEMERLRKEAHDGLGT